MFHARDINVLLELQVMDYLVLCLFDVAGDWDYFNAFPVWAPARYVDSPIGFAIESFHSQVDHLSISAYPLRTVKEQVNVVASTLYVAKALVLFRAGVVRIKANCSFLRPVATMLRNRAPAVRAKPISRTYCVPARTACLSGVVLIDAGTVSG